MSTRPHTARLVVASTLAATALAASAAGGFKLSSPGIQPGSTLIG